jgi:pimeloyl-ACP methyl ester carboxylesterase
MYKFQSLLIGYVFIFFTLLSVGASSEAGECVIILHGLGKSKYSMKSIERSLKKSGYITWNETYPSRKKRIEDLSVKHIDDGLHYCKAANASKVNFVTHSMGGILVRYYLQNYTIDNLGNIVMLSPPNKGSEVTDHLKDTLLYHWVTGPAGQQLGTTSDSLPNSLNEIEATIGVITGNRTLDPWFSPFIRGEDDGKVSVDRAKLDEMSDFLVVESGHTFIVRNSSVMHQIKYFLKNGKFDK